MGYCHSAGRNDLTRSDRLPLNKSEWKKKIKKLGYILHVKLETCLGQVIKYQANFSEKKYVLMLYDLYSATVPTGLDFFNSLCFTLIFKCISIFFFHTQYYTMTKLKQVFIVFLLILFLNLNILFTRIQTHSTSSQQLWQQ